MGWRDRILNDGADRDAWLAARAGRIGASDAAGFAKPDSVDRYVLAKLKGSTRTFTGNSYTESGNFWEPMLLAWAGVTPNKAFIHAPGHTDHGATPDGLTEHPDGTITLAEIKAKHGRIVTGPDPKEWRQMAWQLYCVPEAAGIVFVWGEIVNGELREGNPQRLDIDRDHPKIVAALDLILPIAAEVSTRLRYALQAEKELIS